MIMKPYRLFTLVVVFGLFYFSEGKPCPEKTRAHKSRCDTYYKCVVLSPESFMWIPEKCDQGLIYEPNLRMCVLPGNDWECNLGDINRNSDDDDDNVVYGVDELSEVAGSAQDSDAEVESSRSLDIDESEEEEFRGSDYISVGSGSHINEQELEGSGEGAGGSDYILLDTTSPESKTSIEDMDLPHAQAPTKVDPKLTAHLQRLSQLIDGLKQTYQNKETADSELRPDQLNAFLAHYNIKAQLDSLSTAAPAENMQGIDQLQQNQTHGNLSTLTSGSNQLDPETKVVLTNQLPNRFNNARPTDGYSNSQIVVNKPEGSVLFTLGNQQQDQQNDHRYDPKISEETLKTVLELSKQMIENQNVRRVIPNSAYYPQVVQPIYLPPPIPQYANSIFNQHDGYNDKQYDKVSSTYFVPQEKPEKPATTIIHNNVIPVHVSSSSDDKTHDQVDSYGQKINSYPPLSSNNNYNSGESSEVQDHQLNNRYENNQLVTIRPNPSHNNFNNFNNYNSYHQNYRPTTTSRPYISDSGSTLTDYYTPSPHLDESNVNNVFQAERYPTVNYGNIPSRLPRPPTHSQSNYNANRPEPGLFIPNNQQQSQPYYNPYQSYYYPNQQSILQLFPSHLDPSKVKIRPNSQKLESMEQETADDGDDDGDQNATGSIDYNQPQIYNQFNANKQITTSQLAQYVEQLTGNRPQMYSSVSSSSGLPNRARLPPVNQDVPQIEDVNYAGNLLAYDIFNTKYTPDEPLTDPLNCPTGVRQSNTTDCTKYFICSKEDGRTISYSCPQFTAFNPQTRICDAQYYAICHPTAVISRYTISENRRIQMEAIKALQDAKRIRDQAQQAHNIALRLRLGDAENGVIPNNQYVTSTPSPYAPLRQQFLSDPLSSFLQNAIDSNAPTTSVTPRPPSYTSSSSTGVKKRKYYCKEGDKVADQTSIYNYFVCYKNAQGVMKGHKMSCSEGLLFCPMSRLCTLPTRCT